MSKSRDSAMSGFIAPILVVMYTYSVHYEVLQQKPICIDILGSVVPDWAWRSGLPDLTELLKLQVRLNEVVQDASEYPTIKDHLGDQHYGLFELYSVPGLTLSDLADLTVIAKRVELLWESLLLFDYHLLERIPEQLLSENQPTLRALDALPMSQQTLSAIPFLRVLGRVYEALRPGYARWYRIRLSTSAHRTSLLWELKRALPYGKRAVDTLQPLEGVARAVLRSLEAENARRKGLNAQRTKHLQRFKWLLPDKVESDIQEAVATELLDLHLLSELSLTVRQIQANLPRILQQLAMLKIDFENLVARTIDVQGCAGVDEHVKGQLQLLETVMEGAPSNLQFYYDAQNVVR